MRLASGRETTENFHFLDLLIYLSSRLGAFYRRQKMSVKIRALIESTNKELKPGVEIEMDLTDRTTVAGKIKTLTTDGFMLETMILETSPSQFRLLYGEAIDSIRIVRKRRATEAKETTV